GTQLAQLAQCVLTVFRLADDLDAVLGGEDHAQARPDQRMVINQENANGHAAPSVWPGASLAPRQGAGQASVTAVPVARATAGSHGSQRCVRPARSASKGGGESGIRTHGRFDPSPVFKTGALNRSAISPDNFVVPIQHRLRGVAGFAPACWRALRLRPASQGRCLEPYRPSLRIACHSSTAPLPRWRRLYASVLARPPDQDRCPEPPCHLR